LAISFSQIVLSKIALRTLGTGRRPPSVHLQTRRQREDGPGWNGQCPGSPKILATGLGWQLQRNALN